MKHVESSYFGGEQSARAHAALLLMAVIWGVNFAIAKYALASVSPLAFNALRFPLAALLLFVVLRRRGPVPWPARDKLPRVLALGLLGNLLYQLTFIFGLNLTTAGNASLLLAGTPIITALLSALLGQERVRPRVWLGVLSTFAGIAMIVVGSTTAAGQRSTIAGNLLMLGASFMWAFYVVGSRPLVDTYGAITVTAWTLWGGTLGILAAGLPSLVALDWGSVSLGAWAAIAYAGLLSIGVAYMIYYYGVSIIGNTRTASYSNIVPVFALIAAWVGLGEVPKLVQIIGAAIIIGGVTIAQSESLARAVVVSPEL